MAIVRAKRRPQHAAGGVTGTCQMEFVGLDQTTFEWPDDRLGPVMGIHLGERSREFLVGATLYGVLAIFAALPMRETTLAAIRHDPETAKVFVETFLTAVRAMGEFPRQVKIVFRTSSHARKCIGIIGRSQRLFVNWCGRRSGISGHGFVNHHVESIGQNMVQRPPALVFLGSEGSQLSLPRGR